MTERKRYCFWCAEPVDPKQHPELPNTYVCDEIKCNRELIQMLRAAQEEAEWKAREDDFNRYR